MTIGMIMFIAEIVAVFIIGGLVWLIVRGQRDE